jgi:hypothetical protein
MPEPKVYFRSTIPSLSYAGNLASAAIPVKVRENRGMTSTATTVDEYLASLPEDRREAISAVRDVILKNLPKGYQETMQYGGIGYSVPHSIYPAGYHCDPKQPLPYCGLASQKNHMALYLGCIYMSPESADWFKKAYAATGKRMDIGKSCVRFRKLDDLPLDVVGEAIAKVPVEKLIAMYESVVKRPKKK